MLNSEDKCSNYFPIKVLFINRRLNKAAECLEPAYNQEKKIVDRNPLRKLYYKVTN